MTNWISHPYNPTGGTFYSNILKNRQYLIINFHTVHKLHIHAYIYCTIFSVQYIHVCMHASYMQMDQGSINLSCE